MKFGSIIGFVQTAQVDITNTTTETSLFSATGKGTRTIPANYMTQGAGFRCRMMAYMKVQTAINFTIKAYLGSTEIGSTGSGAVPSTNVSNSLWDLYFEGVLRSASLNDVATAGMVYFRDKAYSTSPAAVYGYQMVPDNQYGAQVISVTWSNSQTFDLKATMGTAHANNQIHVISANFEVFNR